MKIIKVIAILVAAVLVVPAAAFANDPFGTLRVYSDGDLKSESSGGDVYKSSAGTITTRTTFRDVGSDGWGTKAEAPSQAYACYPCGWVSVGKPETNWYGVADGWVTRTQTAGSISYDKYRSNPSICWHTPWYEPDKCDRAGYHYAP